MGVQPPTIAIMLARLDLLEKIAANLRDINEEGKG